MIKQYTLEELKKVQPPTLYPEHKRELTEKDLNIVNSIIDRFSNYEGEPKNGEMVICEGPNKIYENGSFQRRKQYPQEFISAITEPYIPTILGDGTTTTGGGYFVSIYNEKKLLDTNIKKEKAFKAVGVNGVQHQILFKASVRVWRYKSDEIY